MNKLLLSIKVLILAFVMNLTYLFYFFHYLLPKGLGGLNELVYSLIWYPIILLMITMIFEDYTQKIIFNVFSLTSLYIILFLEVINTFFDIVMLGLFVLYLFVPFFNATIVQLIHKHIVRRKSE
mgnify:CR=1 FL=1